METWVAMGVVAGLVLALIVYGAVADRRRTQRETAQLHNPPERDIPKFAPQQHTPHYLTELEARRTAAPRRLDPDERARFGAARDSADVIAAGYASAAFANDLESGWAALAAPQVLVCADAISEVREIVAPLEESLGSPHPLVIVAPEFAEEVLRTLEVNVLQGLLDVLPVCAQSGAREAIVEATGATMIDHTDLRAGYLPDEHRGHADRWISTAKETWIS